MKLAYCILTILIILIPLQDCALLAQDGENDFCGTTEKEDVQSNAFIEKSGPYCNNSVPYVINSCLEVYVKLNVHFFVDDNCEGKTSGRSTDRLPQEEAFQKADDLVYFTNQYLREIGQNQQLNQAEWGAPVTPAQCVGLRFVLNDIFIHCDSEMETISQHTPQQNYYISSDFGDAYDLFVTNFRNIGGYATNIGRKSRESFVKHFGAQLIAHEVGHSFNLLHAHSLNDGCDDTPVMRATYRRFGTGRSEVVSTCWDQSPKGRGDNVDLCVADGDLVVNTHPCCEDKFVNNNVMTYSSKAQSKEFASLTSCQVDKMFTHLLGEKCDLIEVIDPICPPVTAHIGYKPGDDFVEDCEWSFYFTGSTNEDSHKITYQILESNGRYRIYKESEWIAGRATVERVITGNDPYRKHGTIRLPASREFKITLTTRNACGTSHYSLAFQTGECEPLEDIDQEDFDRMLTEGEWESDPGPGMDEPESPSTPYDIRMSLYPNPYASGTLKVDYILDASARVKVYIGRSDINSYQLVPNLGGLQSAGLHSDILDSRFIGRNSNTIMVVVDGEPYHKQIIKQ